MRKAKHYSPTSLLAWRRRNKRIIFFISLLLISLLAIGTTLAYLQSESDPVTNKFEAGEVNEEINEEFDKTVKKNVTVTNTGSVPAYIRVKLITYRVDKDGNHIGGEATIPHFTPGTNWVEHTDGYYYYTLPVAPDKTPEVPLIGEPGIELQTYTDTDGGHQVVEVLSEAIQATPDTAVQDAWKVNIKPGEVTAYPVTGGEE